MARARKRRASVTRKGRKSPRSFMAKCVAKVRRARKSVSLLEARNMCGALAKGQKRRKRSTRRRRRR